jgi:hypothetical protein
MPDRKPNQFSRELNGGNDLPNGPTTGSEHGRRRSHSTCFAAEERMPSSAPAAGAKRRTTAVAVTDQPRTQTGVAPLKCAVSTAPTAPQLPREDICTTDFSLEYVKLYVERGVILLPSEH